MLLAQTTNTTIYELSGGEAAGLGVFMIVIILFSLAAVAVQIWALIDVIKTPEEAFVSIGQTKTTWLIVTIGAFVCGILWFGALYYLFAVRPKLKVARGDA